MKTDIIFLGVLLINMAMAGKLMGMRHEIIGKLNVQSLKAYRTAYLIGAGTIVIALVGYSMVVGLSSIAHSLTFFEALAALPWQWWLVVMLWLVFGELFLDLAERTLKEVH